MIADKLNRLSTVINDMLQAARIPGAAIAIVAGGGVIFARGFGWRDIEGTLPVTSDTLYPIASTSKAINATLLGMLVDEGMLDWDAPVQQYLPQFRLKDVMASTQATLRDLISMRTGMPRHDWVWTENPMDRAELIRRLQHLELSAGFRQRYQYNNLMVTAAGHVAEVVTGQRWEALVQERIFGPLEMNRSGFERPATDNVTLSYHENNRRELVESPRFASEVTAPSGGAIYSTVQDMARWIAFNLGSGQVDGRQLVHAQTLKEIHSPQTIISPSDAPELAPNAAYAMGWFVDRYQNHARLSHGGYVHDVNSHVALFPKEDIGIVAFTNFGPPLPARLITEHAFALLAGVTPAPTVPEKLAQYENMVEETRQRDAAVPRIAGTKPSHSLSDYAGVYRHQGYGTIEIQKSGEELALRRNRLLLPLQHWHYDAWIAKDCELFFIHVPHEFDQASRMLFETDADGRIGAISIRLEPAVPPIRFVRESPTGNPQSK